MQQKRGNGFEPFSTKTVTMLSSLAKQNRVYDKKITGIHRMKH